MKTHSAFFVECIQSLSGWLTNMKSFSCTNTISKKNYADRNVTTLLRETYV